MKSALTILLVTSFIGVAVFGSLGMGHIDEMAHRGCLAALAQNGVCPLATSAPLTSAFYHMDILRSFSTALFANAILLLALAAALVFGLKNELAGKFGSGIRKLFFYAKKSDSILSSCRINNLSWLSLHLNSPAVAASA